MSGATTAPGPARLASLHDVELATLAATGGRAAYGELVRRHGSAVRGLLRRMGADPATADDVAQDAFLAGFEAVAEFRGEGTFAAWIKRTAARLYLRRFRRKLVLDFRAETPEPDQGHAGEADAAGRIDLDEAMKALPKAERVAVGLCYGAGLSHTEAAELLGVPLGTVKSHVKRGLDRLRGRLAPAPAEERRHVGS
jgi:RNA polymerase sigma factor (sigma-70 family)